MDLHSSRETGRIPVRREPVAATLAGNGKYWLVANLLPAGRADADTVAAVVSVVDWAAGKAETGISAREGHEFARIAAAFGFPFVSPGVIRGPTSAPSSVKAKSRQQFPGEK